MQTVHSIFAYTRWLLAFVILAGLLACTPKETNNKNQNSTKHTNHASAQARQTKSTIQTAASAPAKKLRIQVRVNSKQLEQDNKTYTVPNNSAISVICSRPCTFSASTTNMVTAHDVQQRDHVWLTPKLQFKSEKAQFILKVQANGQEATLTFQSEPSTQTDASWSLDQHVWHRKESIQTVTPSNDYMLNMHNYNPNGSCAAQRKFACSFLAISVKGTLATGDFAIDPNFLTKAYKPPQGIRVNVHVTHGDNNAPGEHYRPISGAIRVTKNAAGKYQYSTIGTVIVQRFNPKPGNAPYPETMRLRINNAH